MDAPIVGNLLLVRGLPGKGKSTFGELLGFMGGGSIRHLEADQFFCISGQYRFDPTRLHHAHQWCQDETEFSMTQRVPMIVVTNTFTRNWEMKPYIELAKKYFYRYTVVTVESGHSPSGLAGRNIHGVPQEAIEKMAARWEQFTD
jgi:hypothetical protein